MLMGVYDLKNENFESVSDDDPMDGLGRRWSFQRARRNLTRRLMRRKKIKRVSKKGMARRKFLKSFRRRHPKAWRAVAERVQHMRRMRGKRAISGLAGLSGPVETLEAELGIDGLGGVWDDITGAIKRTAGRFIKNAGDKAALSLGLKQADKGFVGPPRPSMLPQFIQAPGGGLDIQKMLPIIGGAAALMFMLKKKK